MLHLRVICPPDRTAAVWNLLLREPGATHVTLLPGVAVAPAGDVVEADLAREATDGVLGELRALRLDRDGGITLDNVDTTLSDAADAAEESAPGDPADALIWDQLVDRTSEESQLSASYLVFLTIACVLTGVALLTGSPVTLVGAMVLSPEFGPLAAIAVGAVLRRTDLARRGVTALLVGFPVAMVVTAAATIVLGLVGLLETATTVPAAGFISVALVQYSYAARSLLQLTVNVAGVVIAAVAVLLLLRRASRRRADRRPDPG